MMGPRQIIDGNLENWPKNLKGTRKHVLGARIGLYLFIPPL